VLKDQFVAAFTARQAFQHAVEFLAQLADLVMSLVAQAWQVLATIDATDFQVESCQAAQHPILEDGKGQRRRQQDDQQGGAEKQVDGLLALQVVGALAFQVKGQSRLALAIEQGQLAVLVLFVEAPRAEQGMAGQAVVAHFELLLGAAVQLFVTQVEACDDLVLLGTEQFAGEVTAHHQHAARLALRAGRQDRRGRNQQGQVDLAEGFHAAIATARVCQVQAALTQQGQGLFLELLGAGRWLGVEDLQAGHLRHAPALAEQATLRVVEQDEVQAQVIQGLFIQVAADEGRVAVLDKRIAVVPPGPVLADGPVVEHFLVPLAVQFVRGFCQLHGVQLIETLQQQVLAQPPDARQAGQGQQGIVDEQTQTYGHAGTRSGYACPV